MITLVLLALTDAAEDRPAARLASALAARYGAELDALAVCDPAGSEPPARREDEVRALLADLLPLGMTPRVRALRGDPCEEFSLALRQRRPEVLVIGRTAGQTGGTCADDIAGPEESNRLTAANLPCAVLVAPPSGVDDRPSGPFERILCAVDLDDAAENGADDRTAAAVLDFAARFTAREGAELTVLHVVRPQDAPPRTPQPAAAMDRLTNLCQGLPGAGRFALAAGRGDPADEILTNAEARKAELIVLAPGMRPGVRGVCARVLRGARTPVLLAGPAALAAASATLNKG